MTFNALDYGKSLTKIFIPNRVEEVVDNVYFIEDEYFIIQTDKRIYFLDFYMYESEELEVREGNLNLEEIMLKVDMKDIILNPDDLSQVKLNKIKSITLCGSNIDYFCITFEDGIAKAFNIEEIFNVKIRIHNEF